MNIFYSMGDRIYPDIGYIGKDYTTFDFLIEHYGDRRTPKRICI